MLHVPVERTRCFLKWRICFTRGSERETQQPRGTGRGCKRGKVMAPNGSAPRLRREPTHSPPDMGKHQNLRGIVGQEESAGAGG